MSDQADNGKPAVPKRGEAAWKEVKDRVGARNDEARKAGKEHRQAYEAQQDATRRAAETRRMAELLGKPRARKA